LVKINNSDHKLVEFGQFRKETGCKKQDIYD
jgi:hypothetical protein